MSLLQIKDAMENELSVPTEDGETKNEAQVISEVLHKRIKKPTFLQNVGIEHKPSRTNMITLVAELEREKEGSAGLRVVVNKQIEEIHNLKIENKKSEEKQVLLEAKLNELSQLMGKKLMDDIS